MSQMPRELKNQPPKISRTTIPILISGILFVVAIVYFISLASTQNGPLVVSGNIEAVVVHLGTRLGGTIDNITIVEGALVKQDDPLGIVKTSATASEQIRSPIDGVVLESPMQVGELVMPGSILFTVADLTRLNLTVFVPEDRYGQIFLGQTYPVKVDSYPDKVFSGQVSHIADSAEFTPRNVQTVQGRKDTVYAVRLLIDNPYLELKPGMPADVTLVPN
jgi:multidrug efflux pump subunit AcrA (membrane-fusion protein)